MSADMLRKLAEPFDPGIVSFRVGPTSGDKKKGMALAYIDARDVMRRLDDACGPENWQSDYPWSDGKRVICRIGIRIGDEWIWKADGAGDTEMEGEKGALSDALKRAAVQWGLGRYLYDIDASWVAIEQHGKSYSIVANELPKLRGRLPRPHGAAAASRPTQAQGAEAFPDAAPKSSAASAAPAGERPLWLDKFFALDSYTIDPRRAGGWQQWAVNYRTVCTWADTFEQIRKLEADNGAHFEAAHKSMAEAAWVHFRAHVEAAELRLWKEPSDPLAA